MYRHIEEDYANVDQLLLDMGRLGERMLGQVTQALIRLDTDLALEVMRCDREMDSLEKRIDEECVGLVTRQQPAARDLRFLVSAMKVGTDLERIGDLAGNIARAVREIAATASPSQLATTGDVAGALEELSQLAQAMVHDSLVALAGRDAHLARSVWERDDAVDSRYHELFQGLLTRMRERSDLAAQSFQWLIIGHSFERIADHATNIAEDVIYLVECKDIRHQATDYGDSLPAVSASA